MQVTQVNDHVTHAVIGGFKTIEMGITDRPEFFHMLSSVLYSDQELAVARETLCNSWDAHIEAGCTDVPVEVTLTDEYIMFKDSGKGIHHDNIGPIYGTMGGSTKVANIHVTGGFGLGCKAAYCITDHFEVTSNHDGVKTIYNMSKSSAEANGKPGITPIASFPTTDTGLQVKIPIKDANQKRRFNALIRRLAANGEIKATLNGEPLTMLPFSTMEHGFLITKTPVLETNHTICLRYGNVIYPIDSHQAYEAEWGRVIMMLNEISHRVDYKIVFQAAPNTISVTPSRESLSMQDMTVATITKLLKDFLALFNKDFPVECLKFAEQSISECWTKMKPDRLFVPTKEIPQVATHKLQYAAEDIVNISQFSALFVEIKYPSEEAFANKELALRLDTLIQQNYPAKQRNLMKSYRSEIGKQTKPKNLSNWLHRKIIWPLVRDIKTAGLSVDKLIAYAKVKHRYGYGMALFQQATRLQAQPLREYLPYLRNIVVLTHNRLDVETRVNRFPMMKHWLGEAENFLIYITPRSPKKTAEARAFFESRDIVLLDLTVAHPWEPKTALMPVFRETGPAIKRDKGVPTLASLFQNGDINMQWLDEDDANNGIVRTQNPEFVVKLPRSKKTSDVLDLYPSAARSIIALWGTKIGVCINEPQMKKQIENGARPLEELLLETVPDQIINNKNIHDHISYDYERMSNYTTYATDCFFKAIYDDAELRKEFKIIPKLTGDDFHYLNIYNAMAARWPYKSEKPMVSAINLMGKVPVHKTPKDLQKKIENSKLRHIIEPDQITYLLSTKHTPTPKNVQDLARKILIQAINEG